MTATVTTSRMTPQNPKLYSYKEIIKRPGVYRFCDQDGCFDDDGIVYAVIGRSVKLYVSIEGSKAEDQAVETLQSYNSSYHFIEVEENVTINFSNK